MRSRWLFRVLACIAAAIVGGVFGVAGTISHSVEWGPVPVGLIVASITCLALLVAIRALTRQRLTALAAGVGMVGMVVLLSGVGPGGSVVVPDTPLAQIWLIIVSGSAILVAAWPDLSKIAAVPESEGV